MNREKLMIAEIRELGQDEDKIDIIERDGLIGVNLLGTLACKTPEGGILIVHDELTGGSRVAQKPDSTFVDAKLRRMLQVSPRQDYFNIRSEDGAWMFLDGDLTVDVLKRARATGFTTTSFANGCDHHSFNQTGAAVRANIDARDLTLAILHRRGWNRTQERNRARW